MCPERTPVPGGKRLPWRPTDRIEDAVAWFLTAVALILLIAAGAAGFTVHHRVVERGVAENATRWQASAVLLEDTVALSEAYGERLPVRVAARWTDRTGNEQVGTIAARAPGAAGSVVDVWIDADGRIVDPPVQPLGAVLAGGGVAGGVLAIGGGLLYVLWSTVRWLTAAANDRRWEREWARVGPEWSRRVR